MKDLSTQKIFNKLSSIDLKKIKFVMEASKIKINVVSQNKLIQIKLNGLLDIEDFAFAGEVLNRELFEETLNKAIFEITNELSTLCNNNDFSDINIFETISNHKKSSQE